MSSLTYYISISDIIIPLISIPALDFMLCILFGIQTRWFQLHSVVNGIIVCIVYQDVISLYINPIANNGIMNSKLDCYYIIFLHIYHLFISSNLTFMDYFHHGLFIGGGCIPAFLFFNSNLVRLASFAGCGLTGCVEYFTLALVKHNKLKSLTQKKISSYMYNYVRYPLSLYSIMAIYIVYLYDTPQNINPYLLIYVNLIIFFNGAFYNKLTIENYIEHKNIKQIN